mmetsp:Transcript_6999/g.28260  ORF Transcript_6999/g.28260 Transcript_6999/m.28260 type:complete len:292 (-) Transcript_6999:1945-2820(-)
MHPHQRRHPALFVQVHVRLISDDRFAPSLVAPRGDGEQIRHGSARREHRRLESKHLRHFTFERLHRAIVAEDVVPDLGARHRFPHARRRFRHRVAPRVDDAVGESHGERATGRTRRRVTTLCRVARRDDDRARRRTGEGDRCARARRDRAVDDAARARAGARRVARVARGKSSPAHDDDDDARGEAHAVETEWKSARERARGGEARGGDGRGRARGGGAERARVLVVREAGEGYSGAVVAVVRAGVGWDEVQTIEERLEAVRNRVDARAAEATGAERREREFGRVPRRLAH